MRKLTSLCANLLAFLLAVSGLSSKSVLAQASVEPNQPTKVVVFVRVAPFPGINRAQLEEGMVKSLSIYRNLPGLLRKYFIISDDLSYGGIYLWENRKVAEAWYTDSVVWHNGASKLSGRRAEITYFDAPIIVDNHQSSGIVEEQTHVYATESDPTVAVVKLPPLAGVSRLQIMEGMAKSVPTYQDLSGLIRKYFIVSDNSDFGGVYLWDNQKAAKAWYTDSVVWHEGVSKTSGRRAEITYFSVPLVLDNTVGK